MSWSVMWSLYIIISIDIVSFQEGKRRSAEADLTNKEVVSTSNN